MNASPFTTVIGLEVHVQLKTQTKLFCRCGIKFGEPANTQVCPVCLGLPGSLPVLNRKAVELSIRTGLALNCQIAPLTKWDRKNYFYPDLPKGYQTSQFDLPIASEGSLQISDPKGQFEPRNVRIIRAHLEEDAGKSMHDEVAGKSDSRIDLNRAGTPLLEIVSYPDLRSAQEAKAYLTELRLLLLYLGVSDCNMQEGSLRADANVNLHIPTPSGNVATPIVEIKNLNSFRAVERAITYESQRQYQQYQRDGIVLGGRPKQTRGWDDVAGVTSLQREKEESSDYRYFPCPDLVPVRIESRELDEQRASLPELPQVLRERLVAQYELKPYDADVLVSREAPLSGMRAVDYFEKAVELAGGKVAAKEVNKWMQQELFREIPKVESRGEESASQESVEVSLSAEGLAKFVRSLIGGRIDTLKAKDALRVWMVAAGQKNGDQAKSIEQLEAEFAPVKVDRGEIEALCRELLAANPKVVAEYRGGNAKSLGSLIGQAKKKNANADPRMVQDLCKELIDSGAV